MAADPKSALNGNRKFNPAQPWRIEDSLDLYNVAAWGKGYFSINAAGHVVVRPDTTEEREIDLYEVVEGLQARDLSTPVVVRFSDILAHRLKRLHDAFASAIAENDYKNRYSAVYPIKVNQQRLVVEEVYRYGREYGFGLEVGSKPELLAVMAMTENAPERAEDRDLDGRVRAHLAVGRRIGDQRVKVLEFSLRRAIGLDGLDHG